MSLKYKIKYVTNKFKRINTQNAIIFGVWNCTTICGLSKHKEMFLYFRDGNNWIQ